jgi:auxin efflux carrier family protein
MTLTATAPFTTQDQSLGIAYISIIIVWCFLTMFPFGGWMLIKRDFETPRIQLDIEARGLGTGIRWLSCVKGIAIRRARTSRVACAKDSPLRENHVEDSKASFRDANISAKASQVEARRPSISSPSLQDPDIILPVRLHSSQVHDDTELQDISLAAASSLSRYRSLTTPAPMDPRYKRIGRSVLKFLISLISPPAIACLLSLLIALVPQLKALFIPSVPGVDMPDAPDGLPPLEWILDIATFGGTAPRYLD